MDYSELDAAILARIERTQPVTFTGVWVAVEEGATKVDTGTGVQRAVDRRLQALRKRGFIAYSKGAWRLA